MIVLVNLKKEHRFKVNSIEAIVLSNNVNAIVAISLSIAK